MTDPKTNRRGFIQGAAVGIAGLFLALRGATPAEAAVTSFPLQEIRMPLPLLDIDPPLPAADKARWDYLRFHLDEITDEEKAEYDLLVREVQRLASIGSINSVKAQIAAVERTKIGRGQFTVISFPVKKSGIAINLTQTVTRTRNGEISDLTFARQALTLYLDNYEQQFGPFTGD